MSFSKNDVLNALSKVMDPDINKDLVTLKMIKNITLTDDNVSVEVELTTPACPLKNKIENDCINAIHRYVPSAKEIQIKMGAKVKPHLNEIKEQILPGVKNTIAVASGKGGVGKSTVAVNLAVALAIEGAKVGLIDADIYGPSIPLMLGINERPAAKQLENGVVRLLPLERYGVKLMSIGFLMDNDNPVIWRGPMASGAIKQFMSDIEWGELDYMIFDLPPGTGDIQLTLVQTIPLTGAVIVTTPQDVALIDARKGLKMFQKVNVPVIGIIENMSYFIAPDTGKRYEIFGYGGGKKAAKQLEVPFLGEIPINANIRIGGDAGSPIVIEEPESAEAKSFLSISGKMAAQISIKNLSMPVFPKISILNNK